MAKLPPRQPPFDPRHGEAVEVAPNVVRVTASNAGPFTGPGTNSYVVGRDTVAVIDPGPSDPDHLAALERAIAGRPVSHVLVTHTHADHSPLASPLAERTGALVCAEGPHRAARELAPGEENRLEASADRAFAPDRTLAHSERIDGDGWTFETVLTPGHTMNHAAFALVGTGLLFPGDHVMGWSTTIVAPPDGSMRHYMASLDVLLARDDTRYLPGHGGALEEPRRFTRHLKGHRLMRERMITERVEAGDQTIPLIVENSYAGLDPRLRGAAALSVLAHLEDLAARGVVAAEPSPRLDARYHPNE